MTDVLIFNTEDQRGDFPNRTDPLVVLLPLLIVLSTLLFLLLLFLVCIILLRRRRSIILRDHDGPVDLSREEFLEHDGGFDVIESRWLDSVDENERTTYRRAKAFQQQYPPNSLPTDITLSQFLSIQEKGVSAWSFEPDYESLPNTLVHARTELTFLPDPSSASAVQSNLPLPKLNEVYYWEVKMFDLPVTTNVSIGLATKPYPTFRLPGHSRYSIGYHSTGEKSYNYPFTTTSYGPPLKEGDVLGVGYRPRTGAVFFTRNGRKMDEAFVGLNRWNLFPTVGADGPCSVHVNLGQAGFVHIEANVKKWGLAPSVGTLAPPPAYGSERGSILLEAGGATPAINSSTRPRLRGTYTPPAEAAAASSSARRATRGSRRPRTAATAAVSTSVPAAPSPLRGDPISPPNDSRSERLPILPSSGRYISPTDAPYHESSADPRLPPPSPSAASDDSLSSPSTLTHASSSRAQEDLGEETPLVRVEPGGQYDDGEEEDVVMQHGTPESPLPPNPPTPHVSDIHLRPLNLTHSRGSSMHGATSPSRQASLGQSHSRSSSMPMPYSMLPPGGPNPLPTHLRPPSDSQAPPAYSPLDAYAYPDGVAMDLPAELIEAAMSGPTPSERAAAATAASTASRRR